MSAFGGYNDDPTLAELYDLVPAYQSRRDIDFYLCLCREAGGDRRQE